MQNKICLAQEKYDYGFFKRYVSVTWLYKIECKSFQKLYFIYNLTKYLWKKMYHFISFSSLQEVNMFWIPYHIHLSNTWASILNDACKYFKVLSTFHILSYFKIISSNKKMLNISSSFLFSVTYWCTIKFLKSRFT